LLAAKGEAPNEGERRRKTVGRRSAEDRKAKRRRADRAALRSCLKLTHAAAFTPDVGWEEGGWLSNRTEREEFAIALTGMMRDGEITRDRASELARMVLRENAVKLYKLK
jgi:hypothetical protein